ncbi:MAG: MFS transporter, partial [Proteobacteria bacterium]|nr:MFS transporter [Pseudomonadota bacterium]
GGNVGYALVATLVARGQQIHRLPLVSHVSELNPAYLQFRQHVGALLGQAGLAPSALALAEPGLASQLLKRQATMLAFNDVSWVLGVLFLLMIPLLLLLPSRRRLAALAR